MGYLEKMVTEHSKMVAEHGMKLDELKTDMDFIKELLLQMKGKKTPSVEGDNSVHKEEKSSEDEAGDDVTEEEEDKPLRSWFKKVELPTFEGNDPLGWLARAEKF